MLPDIATRADVEHFVDCFYARLLRDEMLAPLFLEVARIDLAVHLPHIKNYWCKLLFHEPGYNRHTMNIHRRLHRKQPLTTENFERWLHLFVATMDELYAGENADKAKRIATAIAGNMQKGLCNKSVKLAEG